MTVGGFRFRFQVRGPCSLHKQPHKERNRYGKAGVIKESDGEKSQDKRAGSAPIPEILVQYEKRNDD